MRLVPARVIILLVVGTMWDRFGSGKKYPIKSWQKGGVRNALDAFPTKDVGAAAEKNMIRRCTEHDLSAIYEIINDAAQAYKGVIPADRWHEPYMPMEELKHEIDDGVEFWGYEERGDLIGVMGLQDRGDVDLIRHSYVRTKSQDRGIGRRLLRRLEQMTDKPILIGTWAEAAWAIRFYEKNGYCLLSRSETERLLKKYWKIPERQVATSVVLANCKWEGATQSNRNQLGR